MEYSLLSFELENQNNEDVVSYKIDKHKGYSNLDFNIEVIKEDDITGKLCFKLINKICVFFLVCTYAWLKLEDIIELTFCPNITNVKISAHSNGLLVGETELNVSKYIHFISPNFCLMLKCKNQL